MYQVIRPTAAVALLVLFLVGILRIVVVHNLHFARVTMVI
jgi:hypothetical protein